MTSSPPPANHPSPRIRPSLKAGLTLLELTVVILVLLSFVSILFIGAQAWKRGTSRSQCIMHINSVQKGVRGYANLYGHHPGSVAPGLLDHIIGFGNFVETVPQCPAEGSYSFGEEFGENTIPPIGSIYMTCSLAETNDHEPEDHEDW